MCGICGVVQIGGPPRPVLSREALARMTEVMAHRGPDDSGFVYMPGIGIGARRLSIVDLAGGHQPLSNEDGTIWAAQNGELYNHQALRGTLATKGHRFRTSCDTEVIPHLYEQHGRDFPRFLRGMFGIVVWDSVRNVGVLARDRLGIKPLYYAEVDDLLVFGSELKSVVASGLVPLDLDPLAVGAFLELGYMPSPLTPFKSVAKLMPGERLLIGGGGVQRDAYWEYPAPHADEPPSSFDAYGEGLRAELEEAVELRLMSDVPVGAMLSGGLDSSLIVAMMAQRSSRPVQTFSVGFAGEPNELDDARFVADQFGTEHHELELDPTARVDLAELAWHLDEPVADLSALGFLALSKLAVQTVTVALSGQGADELFGGYRKHQAARIAGMAGRLPSQLTKLGASAARRVGGSPARLAACIAAPGPASMVLAMSSKLDAETRRHFEAPLAGLPDPISLELVTRALGGVKSSPLASTLYLDAKLALVDDMLHYFDRTSMACSLEVRVPFLDHKLVEYAARVPESFKVRGARLERKAVLKRAARGVIPDRIIDKPKVAFFRGAVNGWLQRQVDSAAAEYLVRPSLASGEFVEQDFVRRLLDRNARPKSVEPQLVLSLVMLEVWLSETLPALAAASTVDASARAIVSQV